LLTVFNSNNREKTFEKIEMAKWRELFKSGSIIMDEGSYNELLKHFPDTEVIILDIYSYIFCYHPIHSMLLLMVLE
jgi:hypothetical protein